MLGPDRVDLDLLAMALEDNSGESSWWVDPRSGKVEFCGPDDDADSFEERGLVSVEPLGSREAYANMSELVEGVQSQRAQELLHKAILGRRPSAGSRTHCPTSPSCAPNGMRFTISGAATRH